MNKKIFIIIGIIIVAAAAGVLISRFAVPDFSGDYRLKLDGKNTETMMHISLDGSTYSIRINGVKNLHSSYEVRKTARNILRFADEFNGSRISEYELRHNARGFEGKVWVLPVGEVDVIFEKVSE